MIELGTSLMFYGAYVRFAGTLDIERRRGTALPATSRLLSTRSTLLTTRGRALNGDSG